MIRRLFALSLVAALASPAALWAQDPEPRQDPDEPQAEPPLTEDEMKELMRQVQELMGRAEDLLQRAANTQDPEEAQRLQEEIVRLLQVVDDSRGRQNEAVEGLSELIRRAPT